MMPVNFALIVEDVVVLHCRWDDVEDLFAPICRGTVIHILNKPLDPQQGSKGGLAPLNTDSLPVAQSFLTQVLHNQQSLGYKDTSLP